MLRNVRVRLSFIQPDSNFLLISELVRVHLNDNNCDIDDMFTFQYDDFI